MAQCFAKSVRKKGACGSFTNFGVEVFGVSEPTADVEILVLIDQLLKTIKLPGISLKINSLGSNQERSAYKAILQTYLRNHTQALCEDCRRRIETNPLRVLDCKNPACQTVKDSAPHILDMLGTESREHFAAVERGLTEQGVSFDISQTLVRGLDYYNRTVFEFIAEDGLGAQNTVVGGGRYDGLFHTLGNKIDLPAIGAAGGIERVILLLQNDDEEAKSNIDISLVGADDAGMKCAEDFAFKLRRLGIAADFSLEKKSTKAQMRRADRLRAACVAVIGEQEINSNCVKIKNLSTGHSQEIALDVAAMANFIGVKSQ